MAADRLEELLREFTAELESLGKVDSKLQQQMIETLRKLQAEIEKQYRFKLDAALGWWPGLNLPKP